MSSMFSQVNDFEVKFQQFLEKVNAKDLDGAIQKFEQQEETIQILRKDNNELEKELKQCEENFWERYAYKFMRKN